MTGKTRTWLGVAAGGGLLLGMALLARLVWAQFDGPIQAARIDLARPQAYIASSALARLPRDLVKAPLARELLTEDFAFYYEEHEDRLGLRGAIKRIAYEHDTTLSDRLLAAALDEPAEIAAWADAKGAPRLWALAMTRNSVARALQGLGAIAAGDSQLSVIAKLSFNGAEVTAYALNLNPRRTLALLAQGQRVLVLSDPGLLFDAQRRPDPKALAVVAGLLSSDAQAQGVWRRQLGLAPPTAAAATPAATTSANTNTTTPSAAPVSDTGHTLVASARLLSFGYQAFFPSIDALRLNIGAAGTGLRMQLRLVGDTAWAGVALPAQARGGANPASNPAATTPTAAAAGTTARTATTAPGPATPATDRALWAAVPANPAACTLLPADWSRLKTLAASAREPAASPADQAAWTALAEQLDGPAALCWYARSQLHTPLLVARLRDSAPLDAGSAALASLARWLAPKGSTETRPPARPGVTRWPHEVQAPWGPLGRDEATRYRPTLALQGRIITWSPDDALVELALDTQARRYPGVAEALPPASAPQAAQAATASNTSNGSTPEPTLLVIDPRQLADLTIRETVQVLPTSQDLFRQAAQRHLAPRLLALRKLAPVRVVAQGRPDAQGWVAVDWLPLAAGADVATPMGAPR